MMNSSRHEVLRELARRIEKIQSGRRRGIADPVATGGRSGIDALDALLPQGGLSRGILMEFLAAVHGSGAWTLGIKMAAHVCHEQKTLVIVDAARQFYLPGAIRWGLEIDRCIVLHPANRHDAYHALVQALRCTAVGAVLGWQERLSMRQLRRLQLAAEASGGMAILLRPAGALRLPSCAAARLLVSPVPVHESRPSPLSPTPLASRRGERGRTEGCRPFVRHVQVQVVRCRGRASGQSLVLEIDDETGHVHASASVAGAAVTARPARASG